VLVGDIEMRFYQPPHLVLRPVAGMDQILAAGLDDFYVITPSFRQAEGLAPGSDCAALHAGLIDDPDVPMPFRLGVRAHKVDLVALQ
jgi:hypothetical protein